MTLCIAWKCDQAVHFASDSRLTLKENSYADVGVKILALPFQIFGPGDHCGIERPEILLRGELGMCFAGSAVNSLTVKEALAEVLKALQCAPGHSDLSMDGVVKFAFAAYREISTKVCETALGPNGRAEMLIGGFCSDRKAVRVFRLSTNDCNQHSCREVLLDRSYEMLGSGATSASVDLPTAAVSSDYINVLKSAIDNPQMPTVGGNIQYGCFEKERFVVHGVYDRDAFGVRYWRTCLDLNSDAFMNNGSGLVTGLPFVDWHSAISI